MSTTPHIIDLSSFRSNREADVASPSTRHLVRIGKEICVGGRSICLMAGPCSVETEEQLLSIGRALVKNSTSILRGGIFKPRTSPYTFQGLGKEGINFIKRAKEVTGMPVVTEILDVRLLDELVETVDLVQVGARNMYNYPLLKELGQVGKPILLKRSMMATIDEFIGAAEYILSRGNPNVILCERGIRSFDNNTRFCLDLNAVPVLKERTKLPIVVDPSHGTGVARYVEPMSLAAIAAGADGLLIEVHNNPQAALSDGKQSLDLQQFEALAAKIRKVAQAVDRAL